MHVGDSGSRIVAGEASVVVPRWTPSGGAAFSVMEGLLPTVGLSSLRTIMADKLARGLDLHPSGPQDLARLVGQSVRSFARDVRSSSPDGVIAEFESPWQDLEGQLGGGGLLSSAALIEILEAIAEDEGIGFRVIEFAGEAAAAEILARPAIVRVVELPAARIDVEQDVVWPSSTRELLFVRGSLGEVMARATVVIAELAGVVDRSRLVRWIAGCESLEHAMLSAPVALIQIAGVTRRLVTAAGQRILVLVGLGEPRRMRPLAPGIEIIGFAGQRFILVDADDGAWLGTKRLQGKYTSVGDEVLPLAVARSMNGFLGPVTCTGPARAEEVRAMLDRHLGLMSGS